MHATLSHSSTVIFVQYLADSAYALPSRKKMGRLINALFNICDYEAANQLCDTYASNKSCKDLANELAISYLINAADYLYCKNTFIDFFPYIDLINLSATHNDRLKIAISDFKKNLQSRDIDSLEYSEFAHMILDDLG